MIQTDDLDKPLAERCDQFSRLVEVNKNRFLIRIHYQLMLLSL